MALSKRWSASYGATNPPKIASRYMTRMMVPPASAARLRRKRSQISCNWVRA
jgi:hypothetical protein